MRAVVLILLGGIVVTAPAFGANPLRDAAEDATNCRELREPDARLACFDAASERLAEALGMVEPVARSAETETSSTRSAEPVAAEPTTEADDDLPTWAAAPQPRQNETRARGEDPRRFEATIVRITRNRVGRHRFYTEDGAVWEQTQNVEVRPPRSLPAVAEFRRRLTGNPTIKFDVSNRSYRVRRIE